MNQDNDKDDRGVMDPFFDLDNDGKVSLSETIHADSELAAAYIADAKKHGGLSGWTARILGKILRTSNND